MKLKNEPKAAASQTNEQRRELAAVLASISAVAKRLSKWLAMLERHEFKGGEAQRLLSNNHKARYEEEKTR